MTPEPGDEPHTFVGMPSDYGPIGIYGGHFVGQAVSAGLATVDEPKLAHSLHAYFLKRGDPSAPIEYRVFVLRNGRMSDARSISAWQNGVEVFYMTASFKVPEDGDTHQPVCPEVPSVDAVIADRESRNEPPPPIPPTQNGWSQMEWASPSFFEFIPDREPSLKLWMRTPGDESLTERQRQVVLAFLCDGPLVFNSVLPHGTPFDTHSVTSLDHAAWFHAVPDPSEWMLFDQRTTAAADGRGMNMGEIYSSTGALIMTCAQESMLRRIPST